MIPKVGSKQASMANFRCLQGLVYAIGGVAWIGGASSSNPRNPVIVIYGTGGCAKTSKPGEAVNLVFLSATLYIYI